MGGAGPEAGRAGVQHVEPQTDQNPDQNPEQNPEQNQEQNQNRERNTWPASSCCALTWITDQQLIVCAHPPAVKHDGKVRAALNGRISG